MASVAKGLTEQQKKKELRDLFNLYDADGSGQIDKGELKIILGQIGVSLDDASFEKMFKEADTDGSGEIDYNEFIEIVKKADSASGSSAWQVTVSESRKLIKVKGAVGEHSYAQEEMTAYAEHFNTLFRDDPQLAHIIPIEADADELAEKVRDGILLAKFINVAEPGTIDMRAMNLIKKKPLSKFQINENLTLVISAAKSIGCQVTNVGPDELRGGKEAPHMVLGLVWQLVKLQLLNSIDLKNCPELYRLLEDGEDIADLLRLPPEQLLLRWFNFHLKAANYPKRVTNFTSDICDAKAYTVLLNQLSQHGDHELCDLSLLDSDDVNSRAVQVIHDSRKVGTEPFIGPADIVKKNKRLNLGFTAAIFNACPGLEPITEEEAADLAGMFDDDAGDSREERAFRMWINTLGIDDLYIRNLFEDLDDGLVLLKVMDFVEPGSVPWKRVQTKRMNKFAKVGNCNIAVEVGKARPFAFSLVGIGGSDIHDKNKKLILAIVWQLMRHHTIKYLTEAGGGKKIEEKQLVAWANSKVSTGRKMNNLKDPALRDSLFFLDVEQSLKKCVDPEIVTDGVSEEDAILNARYAISIARKFGATIFLLPEDIVEVKPKMLLTFTAALYLLDKQA